MNQDQSLQLHSLLTKDDPTSRIEAANLFFQWTESDDKVTSLAEAEEVLYSIYIELLNRGQLTEAALLLWGNELFDPRPRSVQMIWNGLKKYNKILIPGASSLGKSYNPAAWAILWWTHDPKYTSIKVVSVTGEHAASQIMATMKMFHEASVIPLPGVIKDRSIDLADGDKRASISRVSIPQGPDIKGRLRGFHPQPRPWHPIFGKKTRIAVIIDEGEDVPSNIWEGIENLLATEGTNTHHIKIVSGANPKKRESPYAQRCEYPGGWQNFDLETSDEWDGPEALQSWHVIRLDGAKCENVVEKREVFPNMITYEGYMNYVRKGTNSSEYFTFARGAWPEAGAEFRITPSDNFKNSTGTLVFSGDVHSVASLDPAFSEGGDSAVMTVGKYGMAIGWTTADNKYNKWDISHPALQIEQQFPVPKDNTLIMAQTIMRMLKALDVRAEWFVMDRTGNAHGLYDAIRLQYGDILGQQWGEGATIKKILEEDSMNAEDQYAGVNTEMMFAFSKWLEFGYVKFAPMMDVSKIYNQAINRKYVFYKTLSRAEDKISYKASSGGQSPDEYDSAIMLVHLARMRHAQKAHMLPATLLASSEEISDTTEYGVTDVLGFVDLSLDK